MEAVRMKGWEFTDTHVPLKVVEKPDPVARPGHVVIDIKASGLCHSDVGLLEDEEWLKLIDYRPIIIGHEFAGIIAEVGEGVTDFKVGERVGVCPIGVDGKSPGYGRDGGYANKALVPAGDLVRIPEGVSFTQAATATDAGMTSYHAMFKRGGAKAGMKVGLIGVGGLGQIAARAAVIAGCEVYAADISPAARELAKEIGCKAVFTDVSEMADVAPELIVDYAGFGTTTAGAIEAVAWGGRVVQVGMGRLEATINTRSLITKAVSLIGSVGGNADDIAAVYKLMASGDVKPEIVEITFEEIGEGLERLARGGVKGRQVAVL
jgi:alcohol dehydrogenase, propanol-preferring